jgi:hypothetical protein
MYNTYIRPLLVQACTADYALSRVVQIATQLLITRTVICLTTAQFKSVIFTVGLRLVQYCEHLYSRDVE